MQTFKITGEKITFVTISNKKKTFWTNEAALLKEQENIIQNRGYKNQMY